MAKDKQRQTYDDSLALAQTARTQARHAWIDSLIDAMIAIFPEKRSEFDTVRIDLHQDNDAYVEALNNVDRILVNRVTAIVLNAQMDKEDRRREQ